jgi:alkanesulfonate monooxygenase SsuD/methylene tetrahydromethanopterin reductase-like flavin-dependent oxidoreductase (luciferase family)
MKTSVFLPYHIARSTSELDDLYDRMLDIAVTADQLGYEHIWTPEHHMIRFLASPSALITAVQIGQHVKCRVGTAVIVLPYHSPIQLAGEIASADHAVGGRLEIGVARGAYRYEFDTFGLEFEGSREHFIEMLQAVEGLLYEGGRPTSADGEYVRFSDAYIWPRPKQVPGPPMWLGAMTLPSIEDAAWRGYNVMHTAFLWDEEHVRNVVGAFNRGLERRGDSEGPRPKLMVVRYAAVGATEADVERRVDDLLEHWRVHAQLHAATQMADARGVVEPVPQAKEPDRGDIRRNVLIGSEREVLEKAERYRDMGVDVLAVNVGWGIPHGVAKETLDVLSRVAVA